jgi:HEAT repeat protein
LLDSPDATFELQVAAATVLGPLEDARAVGPLLAKLKGAHPRFAGPIVSTLMWLGDPTAEKPIREILETNRNEELRQRAIIDLGALGGDESLKLLESLLDGELSIPLRTAVLTALQRRGVGDYAPPSPADFAPGGALRAQLEKEIAEERDPMVRAARESALHFMSYFPGRSSWGAKLRHLFLRALFSLIQRGRKGAR